MNITFTMRSIWNILLSEIKNAYGVAGLMANLYAESSLSSECCTGLKTNEEKWLAQHNYIDKINSGEMDVKTFAHDGVAFGLAQWRYWSRKEALYNRSKTENKDISDMNFQLSFILSEIKTYKTVWNTLLNATSVKEASDIVLERYEKPANMSETARRKRASYGEEFYNAFVSSETSSASYPDTKNAESYNTSGVMVQTLVGNVNYRCGNSKKYTILGQTGSKSGERFPYVAASNDGWYAIEVTVNHKKQVAWMMKDFCKLI